MQIIIKGEMEADAHSDNSEKEQRKSSDSLYSDVKWIRKYILVCFLEHNHSIRGF